MRFALLALAIVGCADDLPSRASITGLRVLAIRAGSPALRPDETTALTLLFAEPPVADADAGPPPPPSVGWRACVDPPGGDPVRCLEDEDVWSLSEGTDTVLVVPPSARPQGDAIVGVVAYACRGALDRAEEREHPEVPPLCDGDEAIAVHRVSLSSAPENENPAIEALTFGGVPIPGDGLTFPACEPPCPLFRVAVDPTDDSMQTVPGEGRRESLLVAFAADQGTFDVAFDDEAPFDAGYTPTPGVATTRPRIWIVLHDDRGGVAFRRIFAVPE